MEKLQRLERAADVMERINTITMFVLPPLAAIYGVWFGDWRPFGTSAIIGGTVFLLGLFIVAARDRAKSSPTV